mmetsp:Transcript_14899/g.41175  ORF Transcript_14899/g.41175 Transcript_14899/m.41175 type:complete len:172 (-) Transcript_14899:36-551(-)
MSSKTLAVGYDPVQRAEQWKRRVDREEGAVCPPLQLGGTGLAGPSTGARLDMLQQTLQGAAHPPASARDSATSRSSALRSALSSGPGSASGRSTSGAGRAIAQTPRLGTAGTMPSVGGSVISGSDNSSLLRAELEAETQRRQAAEQELQRLQALLSGSSNDGGSISGSGLG